MGEHAFSCTVSEFAYPPRSFYGFAGYDSTLCLPSQIVFRFCRVRFPLLLTLSNRFSVLQGAIPALAYPPKSFFGFAGYDSRSCLPSQIVFRFCRVRFWLLLTLPDRFSVLLGKILAFAYPPKPVFRSCWVRFRLLLTLPIRFFALAGYDSGFCLPYQIVLQCWRATKKMKSEDSILFAFTYRSNILFVLF